jgi:plastocyanin
MMKHITIPSLFIVLALMLSSCGLHTGLGKLLGVGGSSTKVAGTPGKHVKATHTPPSPPTVAIGAAALLPDPLTVKAGSTVTWINNETTAVDVTSDTAGVFDSGVLNPGASYKFTFTQAGTFTYHTNSVPPMTGSIVVTP